MSQEERPLVKGQVPVDFLVLGDQLHADHPSTRVCGTCPCALWSWENV